MSSAGIDGPLVVSKDPNEYNRLASITASHKDKRCAGFLPLFSMSVLRFLSLLHPIDSPPTINLRYLSNVRENFTLERSKVFVESVYFSSYLFFYLLILSMN